MARNVLSKNPLFETLLDPAINIDQPHIFNTELSKEMKKIGPVMDQKSTGRCWMFAAGTSHILLWIVELETWFRHATAGW